MPASSSCEAASAELRLNVHRSLLELERRFLSCLRIIGLDRAGQRLDVGEIALECAGQRLVTLGRLFRRRDVVQVVDRRLGQRLKIVDARAELVRRRARWRAPCRVRSTPRQTS